MMLHDLLDVLIGVSLLGAMLCAVMAILAQRRADRARLEADYWRGVRDRLRGEGR